MLQSSGCLTVLGYCGLDSAEIARHLAAGRAMEVAAARGHFVVVSEAAPGQVVIVASRSGIVNYFFATGKLGPAHGPVAAIVALQAGLGWSWDYVAIADYLAVGHLLGDRTLHPGVRRVPPGGVVEISGNSIRIEVPIRPSEEACGPPRVAFENAITTLLAAAQDLPPGPCWLSMSGGLDSRLLLAALLVAGRRPHLFVSGVPGSFDREVSAAVAASLQLPLDLIEITVADVAKDATVAAWASNGQLPVSHWAGLAHHRNSRREPCGPVLIGSNGEFARNYYTPQTGIGDLSLIISSRSRALNLLCRRFTSPFTEAERHLIHADLRRELTSDAIRERLHEALGPAQEGALVTLDNFFLMQHGRQKTSADLAYLTAIGVNWRVPFFDNSWVDAVRGLPKRFKLDSWFHRRAIARLRPELSQFPEQGGWAVTASSPRPSYWLGLSRGVGGPPFLDQTMFRSQTLLDLLQERREVLNDLIDPRLIDELLVEQAQGAKRPHLCFALTALALWRSSIEEIGRGAGSNIASLPFEGDSGATVKALALGQS